MDGSKLTSAREISAYLVAHIFGIGAAYLINPLIFAALIGAGYRSGLPLVGLTMSVLIMFIVLFLFLIMRKVFSEQV